VRIGSTGRRVIAWPLVTMRGLAAANWIVPARIVVSPVSSNVAGSRTVFAAIRPATGPVISRRVSPGAAVAVSTVDIKARGMANSVASSRRMARTPLEFRKTSGKGARTEL
jgi:hypothetical protein